MSHRVMIMQVSECLILDSIQQLSLSFPYFFVISSSPGFWFLLQYLQHTQFSHHNMLVESSLLEKSIEPPVVVLRFRTDWKITNLHLPMGNRFQSPRDTRGIMNVCPTGIIAPPPRPLTPAWFGTLCSQKVKHPGRARAPCSLHLGEDP